MASYDTTNTGPSDGELKLHPFLADVPDTTPWVEDFPYSLARTVQCCTHSPHGNCPIPSRHRFRYHFRGRGRRQRCGGRRRCGCDHCRQRPKSHLRRFLPVHDRRDAWHASGIHVTSPQHRWYVMSSNEIISCSLSSNISIWVVPKTSLRLLAAFARQHGGRVY